MAELEAEANLRQRAAEIARERGCEDAAALVEQGYPLWDADASRPVITRARAAWQSAREELSLD